MDIEKQAGILYKRLEKINYKLDNPSLKADKRQQLEEVVDTITEQLKAFEQQLTQLRVTEIKRTTHQ